MYDIPELEKKWRKYKRKQLKKPILFTLFLLLLGVSAYTTYLTYFNSTKINNKVALNNKDAPPKREPLKQQESKEVVVVSKPQPKEEQAIIIEKTPIIVESPTPSPKPIKKPQEPVIDLANATIFEPKVQEEEIRVIGFDDKEKREITKKYEDILIPKQSTKEIKEKEMIKEIEERFKATQDPKDSLWLAKYYYKKGDYAKAELWAINTNNIDGEIEESWLIFAKARAKQGHRVDAIKVLQSYYEETNSAKAKELLDKLRRGKPFK
ncbi:MAG: hypothetical protein GXN91_01240 [Epsilonproteobacteria bacterium]|nr:hypothetical protein [Campylobacterota bacterium]